MPRLTNSDYLAIRAQLRDVWLTRKIAFSLLVSQDQYCLHQYFQPSKDLSVDELLSHRAAISQARPSLPQRAGRALKRLDQSQSRRQPVAAGKRRIVVYAVRRPEPDLKLLAKALLMQARDDIEVRRRAGDDQQIA